MDAQRQELYAKLTSQVANTPLIQYEGRVANNNQIIIKRESAQLFGSHYDRVYVDLFKYWEKEGKIAPRQRVFETSSGSAGVSFAGIGRELGYECIVAMPAGGEKARESAVLQYLSDPSNLQYTPAENYVNGFKAWIGQFNAKNRDAFFLNHSMGKGQANNEVTLKALEKIGHEVLAQTSVDHFISAVGNGSNTLGIGRAMKAAGVKVTAYETFQSAVIFDQMHPGRYENSYGIKPGSLPRHNLPGTSYKGIDFPHISGLFNENIIDASLLISGQEMDAAYGLVPKDMMHAYRQQRDLIRWDQYMSHTDDMGRSTKAGLAAALDLATRVQDKKILIIGYDTANRYDDAPRLVAAA